VCALVERKTEFELGSSSRPRSDVDPTPLTRDTLRSKQPESDHDFVTVPAFATGVWLSSALKTAEANFESRSLVTESAFPSISIFFTMVATFRLLKLIL